MHIDPALLRRCWFLAGPTACGKSAVAMELAPRLSAEIVALDSMTLYRGMDIGTAKPTAAERERVPHHLFDILDPHEEFSVAEYVTAAERCCRDIVARGRTPLFVGGTGLYLRSLLRGVFEGPPANWELRRQWEVEAATAGPGALHQRLMKVDPITAARLHVNDIRRVIRALEVHAVTGRPLSEQHEQGALPIDERPPHVYWLDPPRAWLHDRINRRVEDMFAAGLLDEVRRLPKSLSHTARQALGYKEVLDWLSSFSPVPSGPGDSALMGSAELIDLIQIRTRQFARRQCTWFRNLEECTAVPVRGDETSMEIAENIEKIAALRDR